MFKWPRRLVKHVQHVQNKRHKNYLPILEALESRVMLSGDAFVEPPVLHSQNGILKVTLTEQIGPAKVGDTGVVDAWTYNGAFAAPTLQVNPGDLLDITIVNQLPEPTDLHTHGLHVSPLGNSDNVLLDIEPLNSNHYRIQIPSSHPQGLYWYHPHRHGDVNNQISRGLSGLLIVGRPDGGFPQFDGVPQYVMELKNSLLQGNQIVNPQEVQGVNFDPSQQTFTVNGQLRPTLTLPAGQLAMFNVGNIGNNAFYALQLLDDKGTVVPLQSVAEDGNPFTVVQPQVPGVGMPPGRRWSFTFAPPTTAVNGWKLVSTGFNDGTHQWPGTQASPLVLMTINFTGSGAAPTIPTQLTPPESYFEDLRNATVAMQRTVVFGEITTPSGEMIDTINGAVFPDNEVFQPRLNTVEEWTLDNPTANDHPFHYHTNPQQVTKSGMGNNPKGLAQFQDVINVPAKSKVVIRIEFKDYLGTMVYHCHRVDHEDAGMMAAVQILPQQPILATGTGVGNPPQVNVYDGNTKVLLKVLIPFDTAFKGGVNVAVGDVNGDAVSDIICAAGPGGGPNVVVYSGTDYSILTNFFAFDPAFNGGVSVAGGDANRDGLDDVICGAGPGGGPQVRVFSGVGAIPILSFFAFDTSFVGGVTVAAGDLDGNGRFEIIAGAGAGGGPNVVVFDDQAQLLSSFFAFDPAFVGGVNVATGRVRGIGFASIIVGAGPGGGPAVSAFQSNSAHDSPMAMDTGHATGSNDTMLTFRQISTFFAYDPSFIGGVRVGSFNKTVGTNYMTGAGVGGGPQVSLFDGVTHAQADTFFAYNPTFGGGVSVAAN